MNWLGQVAFMLFCGVVASEESTCSAQEGCSKQQPGQGSACEDKGWIGNAPFCGGMEKDCIEKGWTMAVLSKDAPEGSTGFGSQCITGTKVRCQLCSKAPPSIVSGSAFIIGAFTLLAAVILWKARDAWLLAKKGNCKRQPGEEWVRARTTLPEMPELYRQRRHNATNIDERKVIRKGLEQLVKVFVTATGAKLTDIPKRVMQSSASTLRRLLSGEMQFLQCPKGEVGAAQRDIRHLSLEQLLSIRIGTLDFQSQSESHTCHTAFLDIVDKHMYEKLVRVMLRGVEAPPKSEGAPWLIALGRNVTVTIGLARHLREEVSIQEQARLCVPDVWALALDARLWDACSSGGELWMAWLHTQELWLQPLIGDPPTIDASMVNIAVHQETKSMPQGPGERKLLQGTVYILDAQKDDVPMLLQLIDEPNRAQSALAKELTATMENRSGISAKDAQKEAEGLQRGRMAELAQSMQSRRSS